jgi:hypothetical protein
MKAANPHESALVPILSVKIGDIRPSPENEKLYKPVDPDAPDMLALAADIAQDVAHGGMGIREPLVVTRDGYILSGHRRHAAARRAGLRKIPVRKLDFRRANLTTDEYIRRLAAYNQQRVKSNAEHLREIIVQTNPDDAFQRLLDYRQQVARVPADAMHIGVGRRRAEISKAKEPFLAAVGQVIEERRDYWPLSDRGVHYGLLNDPPLIHAGKPASRYGNNKASYRAATDLLTRARLAGRIPMECISDETRPVSIWDCHPGPRDYMSREIERFLMGYWRDLMRDQPNHIELIGEKLTVKSILERVAFKYRIPLTIGRGYCSLKPRFDIATRFRQSGKDKLILLAVSDFDPDGEEIAASLARSLRDDFDVQDIHAVKVALTQEQVGRFNLPPTMDAKTSSPNYAKFLAENGGYAYELEALPPATLEELVEDSIRSVIDLDVFNKSLAEERADAVFLEGVRRQVKEALAGIDP